MADARPAGRVTATIPGLDFGGAGSPLHFLHANGYPPACYRPLLGRLAEAHHVFGMLLRPLWPEADPAPVRDWRPFSDDLRAFLHGQHGGPVIGVGHSIGAVVTLRAALREPGLFQALVLIDPVLLPPLVVTQLRVFHFLGLADRFNARARAARRRRRHFDDLEQLFAGYRRREVFRRFSDENLHILIEGLTRPARGGGYELVYSPEWEAHIYRTAIWNDRDIWSGLPRLQPPVLIIRGSHTDTFWARTARLMERRNPRIATLSVPEATHLVALERPEQVAGAALDFLRRIAAGRREIVSP